MSHKDSKPCISLSLQDLGLCLIYADLSSLALWPESVDSEGTPSLCFEVPSCASRLSKLNCNMQYFLRLPSCKLLQ